MYRMGTHLHLEEGEVTIFLYLFEDNFFNTLSLAHTFGFLSWISDFQKHFLEYNLISTQQEWCGVCGSLDVIASIFPEFEPLQPDHLFIVSARIFLDSYLFEDVTRLHREGDSIPTYD